MKSIFTDKTIKPTQVELKNGLSNTFDLWMSLAEWAKKTSPNSSEEWHIASEKFGWSFRIKDKKRVLIYLLPRDRYFKIGFVFGQKATDKIFATEIHQSIIDELKIAKVYAEGRGIRIDVKDELLIDDLKQLIEIKCSI